MSKENTNVTIRECRDLRHEVTNNFNKSVLQLEDKLDTLSEKVSKIITSDAVQKKEIKGFSDTLKSHMTDEEKTYKIVWIGMGIFGSGILSALIFLFLNGQSTREQMIINTTRTGYIEQSLNDINTTQKVILEKLNGFEAVGN